MAVAERQGKRKCEAEINKRMRAALPSERCLWSVRRRAPRGSATPPEPLGWRRVMERPRCGHHQAATGRAADGRAVPAAPRLLPPDGARRPLITPRPGASLSRGSCTAARSLCLPLHDAVSFLMEDLLRAWYQ